MRSLASFLTILVFGAAIYFAAIVPLLANYATKQTEMAARAAIRLEGNSQAALLARRNAERLELLRRTYPIDPDIYIQLAINQLLLGNPSEAARYYGLGLAIEPRPEMYLGLGTAELRAGNRSAGIDAFATACRFSKRWLDYIQEPDVRDEVARQCGTTYP